MNNAIIKSAGSAVSKMGFQLRKHSPEILVVAGVAGTVASAVMACRATLKVNDILEETKDQVDKIHGAADGTIAIKEGAEYTEEDKRKDLTMVYIQTGWKFVKLYGPSVALGALSIASIFASNNILRKRNIALAAAYATIDTSFKDYRKRVIERFGENVDRELKYNLKAQKITETVTDEDGKEKKVKTTVLVPDENGVDENGYARFFDVGCNGWESNAMLNQAFLKGAEAWFNQVLDQKGFVFLCDVYKYFGFRETKASHVVGWVKTKNDEDNENGDNHISFRFNKDENFMKGYSPSVILDFNVDGPILNLIERADRTWGLC